MEKTKKDQLCGAAIENQWSDVFEMIKRDRWLRSAKITARGDTVLHMAMFAPEDSREVVEEMVDLCKYQYIVDEERGKRIKVIEAENEDGNTPLHLAASIGNVEMCKKITESKSDRFLIAKRNKAGATPLFVAALYGQRNAFLRLHYRYMNRPGASSTDLAHCIRDNNDTILHCAIEQDHFDVAIEILHLYKDLVNPTMYNDEGLSPLHLLAEKPSAFRRGAFLPRPLGYIVYYHFLGNMKKEKATTEEELEKSERKSRVKVLKDIVVDKLKGDAKGNIMVKTITWVLDHFELVGQSIRELVGVRKMKQNHTWARQIMKALLRYPDNMATETPSFLLPSTSKDGEVKIESPLLIAAKNNVIEMVEEIVKIFPTTVKIDVVNEEGKNIVLLAVEKRQTDVYKFLCKQEILWLTGRLFKQVDNEGNSALHWAARYGGDRNWKFPGEVLVMQWEYKWLEYVRNSVLPGVFETYNNKLETPDEIFRATHKELSQKDEEWLNKTSGACSIVATLIATAAFATMATVPGGVEKGLPVHLHDRSLQFFVAMSLSALMSSLAATIVFLNILTSRNHTIDFYKKLPFRLFLGMSAMFVSIQCMWISFCTSHSFMLVYPAWNVYLPIYIITAIPGTLIMVAKFPVYWNLLSTSFYKTPAPSFRTYPAKPKPTLKNQKSLRCADVLSKVVKICEDVEK